MKTLWSDSLSAAAVVALILSPACGGGDGGTPPVTVASVAITAPAAAPSFQTLGRTIQFTAQAKDAAGGNVSATFTWSSSNTSVATVSGSGLVTAIANGTAGITAAAGGRTSPSLAVTVSQVAAAITGLPATLAFGALGSSRQLVTTVADSGGAVVAGAGPPVFSRAGLGASATVTAGGLVTSTGVGIGDTAVATAGTIVVRAPIAVTQVVASVAVSSTSGTPDTLVTTTRTRQFSGTARDSNSNVIGAATLAWSSSVGGVATVGSATGLVTAGAADGTTSIQATSGTGSGSRPMVVRHYPATLTISPTSASIITNAGTQLFTGTAQDSVNTNLAIAWASRNTAFVTVSPASGTSTTATGVGNGSTYVVITAGSKSDSAAITMSNQATTPMTAAVNVGDNFFASARNGTSPAVDTVAVNGTVTWTWVGLNPHGVASTGLPSFTSSLTKTGGGNSYVFTFTAAGTYTYECTFHGALMTGRVVVR